MIISKPSYYDDFHCIAGRCPDSCCKEWAVQVDKASAAFYRSLPGDLGDRLRQVLADEDEATVMTIEHGRCPMWRSDGLCRIQAELGEEALCETCRDFPRLRHDYGDFVELTLELSCPEAARLILSAAPSPAIQTAAPGGDAEYDEDAMAVLKATREAVLALLADNRRPVPEALALLLLYGCEAQSQLDGGEEVPFDADSALDSIQDFLKEADGASLPEFFLTLNILTPQWEARLRAPVPGEWHTGYLALARYFVERYWLQAVSDYDLYSRVKLAIIACLLVRHLGGDFQQTAQLFSKEVENDADNVDALLDAAYTHPAFTDDTLLSLLLY